MKAVRFHGKKDIRVESVDAPKEVAAHEVLVKPLCSGICGTDLHEYIAGPIVTPAVPIKVSDGVTDEEAAMIEPAAVALYAADRRGIQAGSTVFIAGAGPIGTRTILCAHAAGAARIFVSEPNAARRETIKRWNICAGIYDPRKDDVVDLVKSHTEQGVGVDVAIECVGKENALNTCVEVVRRRGVVVQSGLHVGRASTDPMLWALKDITLEATWCYPITMWPRIIGLIECGKLAIGKIINNRIRAEDVVDKGFEVLTRTENDKLKILVSTHL